MVVQCVCQRNPVIIQFSDVRRKPRSRQDQPTPNGNVRPSVRCPTSHLQDHLLPRLSRCVHLGHFARALMDTAPAVQESELVSLEQHIARLEALLQASRQVHSSIAVQEVLSRTLAVLVRELELDGAAVTSPSGELLATYGALSTANAVQRRYPLLSRDGTPLAELALPGIGSLHVYEQDFLDGLILQAAVALENATLHERDLQWARVQQDLDAARNIQQSLLPRAMPALQGFSIAGRSSMCFEVGGDYLDAMTLPSGDPLFIVADVAGKGLASAIMATSFRSALRSLLSQPLPLVEIATRVGQQHWEEGAEARRRYVTAILVRLHLASGELEVVNAGHNPALLVLHDGRTQWIEASGAPLGLLPGMTYAAERQVFPPGSRLLLYTDGLTEVFRGDEEFGSERLSEAFHAIVPAEANAILDSLWATLFAFSSSAPQSDDMTALAVCHLGPSQQQEARPA